MKADEPRPTEPERARGRKPYEPPAIHWEEDFEPYVYSTCGKMPGQGGACRAHRRS